LKGGRGLEMNYKTETGGACEVRWLELPNGKDLSEWVHAGGTAEGFKALLSSAQAYKAQETPAPSTDESPREAVDRLANLSTLEFAQQRKDAAKGMGITQEDLKKAVAEVHAKTGTGKNLPGQEITFPDILAADRPVNGPALFQAIKQFITDRMVLPYGADTAITLFIFRTFAFDLFTINPRLIFSSPTHQCGKTTVMELLALLLPKPLGLSGLSTASAYRVVDQCHPTLLLDEADTYQNMQEDLRGVLNSGHKKKMAYKLVVVGDNNEPRKFSTWCPMVLAAIGKLPVTLVDRSIRIDLQRKDKDAKLVEMPETPDEEAELEQVGGTLASQCLRWVQDHTEELKQAKPEKVHELSSRGRNNWHSLLAVATVIGGDCVQQARLAASSLSKEKADDLTLGGLLLKDMRQIFFTHKKDELPSADCCFYLGEIGESPWATIRKGKPLTQNGLARLLSPYDLSTKSIWLPDTKSCVSGYIKKQFEPVWTRYSVPKPKDLSKPDPAEKDEKPPQLPTPPGNQGSKCQSARTPMDTGQTPDFQGARDHHSSTLENGIFANTRAGTSTLAVENQESSAAHTQQDLLDPQKEVVDVDI